MVSCSGNSLKMSILSLFAHSHVIPNLCNFLLYTLQIKFPTGGFSSDAIEEPFLVPRKYFLKESIFLCEKSCINLNNLFPL